MARTVKAQPRTEIASVTLHKDLSGWLDRAGLKDERIVVTRNGKPLAALVSIADLEKLEQDAA